MQTKASVDSEDIICFNRFIYTFCFFNVHEEPDQPSRARARMLGFYIIVFIENSCLSLWWFFSRGNAILLFGADDPTDAELSRNETNTAMTLPSESDRIFPIPEATALIVAVHLLFFFGMLFMLLYYGLCHPKNDPSGCHCSTGKLSVSGSDEVQNTNSVLQSDMEPKMTSPNSCGKTDPTESTIAAEEVERRQALRNPQVYSEHKEVDASSNGPTTPMSHKNWSDIFNRGKRAEKLYTQQYSKEKLLDGQDKISHCTKTDEQHVGAEMIPMKSYSKEEAIFQSNDYHHRQSRLDKLSSVSKIGAVEPVLKSINACPPPDCDKKSAALCNEDASCGDKRSNINNSNLLEPGQSGYKVSALLPKKPLRRSYSASMSCLVEGKYGLSSDDKYTNRGFTALSYTLNVDEVLESMETNL